MLGAPFCFDIDRRRYARVAALLASCGLVLEEQRTFEVETNRQRDDKPAIARVP